MAEQALAHGLHLAEKDWNLVREILRKYIPAKAVWAFGSRATGGRMLKRFSDLDLAVEGTLTGVESAGLNDAFDESRLPIKVDIVELGLADPEFRERIAKDFVVVQRAGSGDSTQERHQWLDG